MKVRLILSKKKIPGISYAITANGIELPVPDITHPLFISNTNEESLKKMLTEQAPKAKQRAKHFSQHAPFINNFLARHSFIVAGFLLKDTKGNYLSGLSTMMLKLGPGLIGGGIKRLIDRNISKGFGGIVIRMRLMAISTIQAEALLPLLREYPGKNLCFVNIGGGTGTDSINTLFLLQNINTGLLKNRKIEINILDIDTFGPDFAIKSANALKEPGGRFNGLDITAKHIMYDWNETGLLRDLLLEKKDYLQVCVSEGGLFEYASDEIIQKNLDVISDFTDDNALIAGSLIREFDDCDPVTRATMTFSEIKLRFLGIKGLKKLLETRKWKIDKTLEGNPRYVVFRLKKS